MKMTMTPELVQGWLFVRMLRRLFARLHTIGSRDTEPTEFWLAVFTFGFVVASASVYDLDIRSRPAWFITMAKLCVGRDWLVVVLPLVLLCVQIISVFSGWRILRASTLTVSTAMYLTLGAYGHYGLSKTAIPASVSFFVCVTFTLAAMAAWSACRIWRPKLIVHDLEIRMSP